MKYIFNVTLLGVFFINTSLLLGQYSIQIDVFESPANRAFFAGLDQHVMQLQASSTEYVYIVDGFRSYAEAEKIRKTIVSAGFENAITLKTAASRMPLMRARPYPGAAGGDPVPSIAHPAATAGASAEK